MKTTSVIKSFLLVLTILLIPPSLQAQRKAKKYKHAPEEVIVLVAGKVNSTFDEAQFPHLKFYYLTELSLVEKKVKTMSGHSTSQANQGTSDFLARWNTKWGLVNDTQIRTLLLDNNGVVAYQRAYHRSLGERPYEEADLYGNIIVSDQKKPKKKALEEYLKSHVTKGKLAKVDPNKSYTKGQEPDFKEWENGDIEGMEFPDFEVEDSSGKKYNIKDLTNGKASFIVFAGIIPDGTYGYNTHPIPMLWHIENNFYNYYQPRK